MSNRIRKNITHTLKYFGRNLMLVRGKHEFFVLVDGRVQVRPELLEDAADTLDSLRKKWSKEEFDERAEQRLSQLIENIRVNCRNVSVTYGEVNRDTDARMLEYILHIKEPM